MPKRYPCVHHKLLLDYPLINDINYLINKFQSFKEHRFLGFVPTYDGCFKSLEMDSKNFMACCVFFCDKKYLLEDEGYLEKPYVLMFAGIDDHSCAKRFSLLRDALQFFEDMKEFTEHNNEQCRWYN